VLCVGDRRGSHAQVRGQRFTAEAETLPQLFQHVSGKVFVAFVVRRAAPFDLEEQIAQRDFCQVHLRIFPVQE
jgi:hypothetical protein